MWYCFRICCCFSQPKVEYDARDQCFVFPAGIKIHGGFRGNEKGLDMRPDIATGLFETVISGDIGIKNDISDNCYHVISYDRLLTIDGVTISNGNANYNKPDYHTNQDITLHRYGGAMITTDYRTKKIQLNLHQVTFSNNQAYNGGALFFTSNPNYDINIAITDCIFENNIAFDHDGSFGGGYGGSIYMNHLAVVDIVNSEFSGNYAQNRGIYIHFSRINMISSASHIYVQFSGGAIYLDYGGILSITHSLFEENIADGYGGALFAGMCLY